MLARYEPLLASVLSDTMLAGWLAGAARATRGLPSPAPSTREDQPSSAPAGQPPQKPPIPPGIAGASATSEPEPVVHFPIIEEATRDLERRRIMTRPEFDELATDAKTLAFTAARVASEEALTRLNEAVTAAVVEGKTLADFRGDVDEALGPDFLSPGHVENIFRTNVSQAYSTGLMETLSHPLVADEFPYLAYHAVHDSRARAHHLDMEKYGLDGTNVYRRDDPIWERFTPPWDYQCRCAIVPMGVEDAARAGVREAQAWLRMGLPPVSPQRVTPPPFNPPLGWNTRTVVRMSVDDEGHEHDRLGRFASKGKGGTAAPAKGKGQEVGREAQTKLRQDVAKMAETPAGRRTLAKGRELAAKVKNTVASGVQSALDGIDAESGGGLTLLAGSLKSKDPVAAAAGVSRLVSTVFRCVHEEMFELMLSQETGGPAIAAKLAAKGIAKGATLAESGIVKATLWAMGKLTPKKAAAVQMSLTDDERELTEADRQLLKALAEVVAASVKEIGAAAGAPHVETDPDAIEKRLQAMLTSGSVIRSRASPPR